MESVSEGTQVSDRASTHSKSLGLHLAKLPDITLGKLVHERRSSLTSKPQSNSESMVHSPNAIPLSIDLILSDTTSMVPATVLLERLKQLQAHVEIDRERGRREVLARRDELLAKGTPEVLLTGMPSQAELTYAVTLRWDDWPDNCVEGHICDINPHLDGPSFGILHQDFSFARFAAIEIEQALGASVRLMSIYGSSIETEFFPKRISPLEWIQDHYANLDSCCWRHDPITMTSMPFPIRKPELRELEPWQVTMENGVSLFLEQLRKVNADEIAREFPSYADYARKYVQELCDFGSIEHCWSVELEGSHHNEALIEYSDWMVLIKLSGVPRGLLTEHTSSGSNPTE